MSSTTFLLVLLQYYERVVIKDKKNKLQWIGDIRFLTDIAPTISMCNSYIWTIKTSTNEQILIEGAFLNLRYTLILSWDVWKRTRCPYGSTTLWSKICESSHHRTSPSSSPQTFLGLRLCWLSEGKAGGKEANKKSVFALLFAADLAGFQFPYFGQSKLARNWT